jgi:hypothetical protein
MKQGPWQLITLLIAFMMAISFSASILVYAQTPEEQHKNKEQQQQQQQKLQQEQRRQQQEQQKQKPQQEQQRQQQRWTGSTPGGSKPGTQPETGQPAAKTGQPGTPGGQQPGQQVQHPTGQPGTGPTKGQPGVKADQPGPPGGQQPGRQVQRPTGSTPDGSRPGTQPQIGQPGAKAGQPGVKAGQPGTPAGQQPGLQVQRPTGQPVQRPKTGMDVSKRPAIHIKQPPQERQRVLTERHREIRPEHNVRAAARFQSERARFRPVSRVAVYYSPEIHRRVFEKHRFHPETYHARRAVFYETYRFRTPAWVFGLQPRFGLWDTPALAFIVAHAADEQYARWYYSHRLDPDVIAWRQEMDRLAAANAELAYQLAVMDVKTQELQARGDQVDNSYVPPEMEDIALAAEVAVPTQDQNDQAPPPDQPQEYQHYQEPQQYQQYQQPAPLTPPASYRKAADIGFILSAAEREGDVVILTVRLKNTAADGRSVALYDDNYRWPKSHLIDESGRSYEVREVYFRKGAERIPMYDTGKTGVPLDGGATVTAHLVFKGISGGSRRATLNLHPFIYYGRNWTEHDVDMPNIVLK